MSEVVTPRNDVLTVTVHPYKQLIVGKVSAPPLSSNCTVDTFADAEPTVPVTVLNLKSKR